MAKVSSSSSITMTVKTLSGLGKLIKVLPTGTVFLFQFLSPILTNNGDCKNKINKYLSAALLGACGLSCFFSTFTDSYKDSNGITRYGLGKLIKVLPTGTVFLFQFLSPILTNNGDCKNKINKYLSAALLGACGLSCFFSTFTDSYKDSNGITRYGIATLTGLWPSSRTSSVNLSSYKLKFGDFVHAFFSLMVFAVVALLDNHITECFFPSFNSAFLLEALPLVIGTISGALFTLFPCTRHGIGYPSSSSSSSSSSTA
ncbi:hypothetical protein RHMOL_Rhmol02G0016900 [Rhododendron molle]|uniref:Uncharacterized protein n=1 Tax=Rhododendron molle TaxID=49168 RepID=A0ACC0PL01_RHOML|nr:hypothetical protein RHMOL_Rhmol02G0016900 [Rhododendron molle]